MVGVTGIEPVRCHHRGILSPLCLPIPPRRDITRLISHHHILEGYYFLFLLESVWFAVRAFLYLTYILYHIFLKKSTFCFWRGRWGSNPLTTILETAALPLRYSPWLPPWDSNPDNPFRGNNGFRDRRPTIKREGIIVPQGTFKKCLTALSQLSYTRIMERAVGLEPTTSGFTF